MFHKFILRVALSLSLAFTGAANAGLITQDILFDSALDNVDTYVVIGSITLDLDKMDDWGFIDEWESFSFYGLEMISEEFAMLIGDPSYFGFFAAVLNPANVWAGIESLDFDVIDSTYGFYNFAGYIDVYDQPSSVAYTLFDVNANLYEFGALAFARPTFVPEPSMIVLLLTGLLGFAARRKQS